MVRDEEIEAAIEICRRLASEASDPQTRLAYLTMAQFWMHRRKQRHEEPVAA